MSENVYRKIIIVVSKPFVLCSENVMEIFTSHQCESTALPIYFRVVTTHCVDFIHLAITTDST